MFVQFVKLSKRLGEHFCDICKFFDDDEELFVKMEELSEILKNNRTEDLTWFCSLSESELDLLISLKKLAIQRAKISGCKELAEKFDLKNLRALGLVVMEYVRKRVQDDISLAASVVDQLVNCNLLKTDVDDTIDIEEILTETCKKKPRRKSRKRLEAVKVVAPLRKFDCLTMNSERKK